MILHAKWIANDYTLKFDANNGSGVMSTQIVKTNEKIKLTANTFDKPTATTDPGYVFAGWATTSTGRVEYADEADYTMGPSDAILYAKWGITREELMYRARNDLDVTKVDTSLITDMSYLFGSNYSFNQDISGWDVSNVTDMRSLFSWKRKFNQDLSGWDVSKVENMESMFNEAYRFNQDLAKWDVSNVIYYSDFDTDSGLSPDQIPDFMTIT